MHIITVCLFADGVISRPNSARVLSHTHIRTYTLSTHTYVYIYMYIYIYIHTYMMRDSKLYFDVRASSSLNPKYSFRIDSSVDRRKNFLSFDETIAEPKITNVCKFEINGWF